MKKEFNISLIVFVSLLFIFSISAVSALSFSDVGNFFENFWNKLTGKAVIAGDAWCNGADITKDSKVDDNDQSILIVNYGKTNCSLSSNNYCNGADITKDTKVDDSDLSIITANYGKTTCSGDVTVECIKDSDCGTNKKCVSNSCVSSSITPASPPVQSASAVSCTKNNADLNQDNKVDDDDLSVLLANWGKTCSSPLWCSCSDINQNGIVNDDDNSLLLSNWGIIKNLEISVATLKDEYKIGEKIQLTDPPEIPISAVQEDERVGDNLTILRNLKEQKTALEIPDLTEEQIDKIAKLNEEKVMQLKEKARAERKYEEVEIKGANVINPVKYLQKAYFGINSNLQKRDLERIDEELNSTLESLGIPLEVQRELDEINNKTTTWTANYNKIFVKPEEYKLKLFGLKIENDSFKLKESFVNSADVLSQSSGESLVSESESNLPDFFDWREQHGENYITSVKEQLACGSCWAFATNAVLEGAINAYYNNPNLDADLSEQDLVSCYLGDGCEGAYTNDIDRLFNEYLVHTGVALESCFPYTAENSECSRRCSNWQSNAWKIEGSIEELQLSRDESELDNNIKKIKEALIKYGPVEVGMYVYGDFPSYSQGIYRKTSDNLLGGHAVTIVGYGKEDGAEYWIVKNSWGEDWGENGYFRIYRGECGIDSRFAYVSKNPISSNPVAIEKLCNDNDNDGYCNWGLGEKPSAGCPVCDSLIKDCDDSDSRLFEKCGILTEEIGIISITSIPFDAEVYVADLKTGDWIYRGKTPLTTKLIAGERKIKISKKDYYEKIVNVNIVKEEIQEISINLLQSFKIISPQSRDVYRAGDIIEFVGSIGEDTEEYKIEDYCNEDSGSCSEEGISIIQKPGGVIGTWDTSGLGPGKYTVTFSVKRKTGVEDVISIHHLFIDPTLKKGWPQRIKFSYIEDFDLYLGGLAQPVVSDVNKDGNKEIFVSIEGAPNMVYGFSSDGNNLEGWPIKIEDSKFEVSLVSTADINQDGYDEILVTGTTYDKEIMREATSLYVYDYKGNLNDYIKHGMDFGETHAPLLVSDLDNDGKVEVIYNENPYKSKPWKTSGIYLSVLDSDLNTISPWPVLVYNEICRPGDEWPVCPCNDIPNYKIIGNLDDDDEKEIIISLPRDIIGEDYNPEKDTGYFCAGTIHALNLDGTYVKGFPVETEAPIDYQLRSADINQDGYSEIIFSQMGEDFYHPAKNVGGLYVLDHEGKVLSGWPQLIGSQIISPAGFGDMDSDGNLEIIVLNRYEGVVDRVNLFNMDGNPLPGWPKSAGLVGVDYMYPFSDPIISDIDNNGVLDVLISGGRGWQNPGQILAFDINGKMLKGFPKMTELGPEAVPTISDLDNNGKVEVIASSWWDRTDEEDKGRNTIYVWELSDPEGDSPWPMFMHDPQHTGCYDCDKETPVKPRPQSKIVNNEDKWISGTLKFQIQKLQDPVSNNWNIVYSKETSSIINPKGTIKLDKIFNPLNVMINEAGNYRIYVEFQGKISSWEFKVV